MSGRDTACSLNHDIVDVHFGAVVIGLNTCDPEVGTGCARGCGIEGVVGPCGGNEHGRAPDFGK